MDLRKLKKLIDLVEDSGIAELEVTEGEEKVRIVKGGNAGKDMVVLAPQAVRRPFRRARSPLKPWPPRPRRPRRQPLRRHPRPSTGIS